MSTHRVPPPPTRREVDKGLNDLAGHLLWQAEVEAARAGAERLADQLPWLTSGQREEVVRVCTADRLSTARAVLQHIADRVPTLRAEYEDRYAELRRRLIALTVIPFLVIYAVTAAALLNG